MRDKSGCEIQLFIIFDKCQHASVIINCLIGKENHIVHEHVLCALDETLVQQKLCCDQSRQRMIMMALLIHAHRVNREICLSLMDAVKLIIVLSIIYRCNSLVCHSRRCSGHMLHPQPLQVNAPPVGFTVTKVTFIL